MQLIGLLAIVFVIALFTTVFKAIGWGWLVFIIAGIWGSVRYFKARSEKKRVEESAREAAEIEKRRNEREADRSKKRHERLQQLTAKYGHEVAVDILNGICWIDQTEEQLLEAKGPPEEIKSTLTSRAKKEIWKYDQTGKNRFSLKITVVNGIVTKID